MTEWIQPEHREIHEWLQSWGRWLKTQVGQGHCASIEHRYIRKNAAYDAATGWGDWNTTPPKRPPEMPLNEFQATIVESVMRIVLPEPRKLLALKYYNRATPQWSARRLHFAYHLYEGKLYTARQVVLSLTRHVLFPHTGRFHNLRLPTLVEIAA